MKTVLCLIGICALTFVTGCGDSNQHAEEKDKFLVTNPLRNDTSLTREYVSQIRSIQHIELQALERGYVENIFVDEGQVVEEGTVLFQIVPKLYRARLGRSQAEFDSAKIEYDNTEQLRKKNIVAVSELNLAKAKLDKAAAELALAQAHLDFTQIKAPFNGITGKLQVRKGSLVEEGSLLTTLSNNDQMWVYFNVPEAEYIDLKTRLSQDREKEVTLMMANSQLYDHHGKITAIEADFNNETGNIAFRATFPNPEQLLRHGQTGNIIMENPVKNALLIPQKATFEILDKRYVYVVDEENKVNSKPISVVAEKQDVFVVGNELSEKDSILLTGIRQVRDGDTIVPEYDAAPDVMASLKVYAE